MTHVSVSNSNANTPDRQSLADRLRAHVAKLAGEIGERNVFRPAGLHAAADYIRGEWTTKATRSRPRVIKPRGAERKPGGHARGQSKPERDHSGRRPLRFRAGSPGANDNASGVAALLEISRGFAQRAPHAACASSRLSTKRRRFSMGARWAAWCMRRPRGRGATISG